MRQGQKGLPNIKQLPRSAGKSKNKIADYFAGDRLLKKKIRRVLRSNGAERARSYAEAHGKTGYFHELENSGLVAKVEFARERKCQAKKIARERRQKLQEQTA